MYIGDIYLPILSKIDKKSVSKITKEITGINAKEPRTVSIRRNLQPITLEGYLYNDGEKDDAQYAEDVEALQYRSAGYCYTKYADLDGFIEIENAEAPQTSEELGVRNYSIEGKYLPATKYERVVEVETEMRENEFNIEFPPHVALPVGATNVRVKTSQDSVKLSAPAFMAGDIPIYRPFPAFYPDDVTHSTGDTPKYDTTAYKMSYNLLDAKDESISYTMVSGVDVPLGSYRVVLRIKADSTVNGDVKITVSDGTNNVVDSLHTLVGDGVWNIVKTASFSILQRGLTYTVTISKATDSVSNIAVNYGFLLPEKRARVAFDVVAEYDVGECKVYDTVTTGAAESDWIQVYNPEHDFAGDIVVQNSMFRWVIKQTAWKDATKVFNISGSAPVEIGKLYNKAFGDDTVAIKFKEIKPNYLKFTFELDTGNATSESTSAKEIDTVEITPFNVVIDKDVIGAYKDHYTFESTPITMVEYENGVIAGIDSDSIYGLIKSVNVTSSVDGDIIETTGSESSDSYVVPFVIPCEITSYLYKQAADLVISKDNGDRERRFFKDDFSVDSSENYTVANGFAWDTTNRELTYTGGRAYARTKYKTPVSDSALGAKISFSLKCDSVLGYRGGVVIGYKGTTIYTLNVYTEESCVYMIIMVGTHFLSFAVSLNSLITHDTNYHKYELIINPDGTCEGWFDGVKGYSLPFVLPTGINLTPGFVTDVAPEKVICWKDVSYAPSISYADNFSSDTTERYQAVTGTVAYDDVNKRMTITAGAGVTAKTRLKSYTQLEGAYKRKLHLPATGTDGDVVAAYFGTDPTLKSGFGIGAIRTAGAWNIATIKGTTVTDTGTVIADLVDGDSFYVEVERDTTHGVVWYYVYKSGKPATASGKLFNTYQEIYDGFWFRNKGAAENSIAVSEIEDRAESIVGRTNVEVTEPFWFRDEFNEDSLGRYPTLWYRFYSTRPTVSGGKMSYGDKWGQGIGLQVCNDKIIDGYISCKLSRPSATSNVGLAIYSTGDISSGTDYTPSGQDIFFGFYHDVPSKYTIYGKKVSTQSGTIPNYKEKDEVEFKIEVDDYIYKFYVNGTLVYTTPDQILDIGNLLVLSFGLYGGGTLTVDDLEISGTRVYKKPIHRGAMLETYHDGTQEVVGTTYINDMNWDAGELTLDKTTGGSWAIDTVNNVLSVTTKTYNSGVSIRAVQIVDGYWRFRFNTTSGHFQFGILQQNQITGASGVTSVHNGGGYIFDMSTEGTFLRDSPLSYIGGSTIKYVAGTTYLCEVLKVGNVITLKLTDPNGAIQTETWTDANNLFTTSIGVCNFYQFYPNTTTKIWDLVAIGFESTSTNGIAACIPPIGGGARYGVEESVYNTFTTANVDKGVYLTSAKVKTTNPNADEVSLDYVNETTSTTLDKTSIVVDADYTIKTTPITIKENETDVLTVGVKNSTTCNQPATYVDSLSLIPVSGDDVLYPQDLAFISGVKPSQKRKVEVK